MSASFYDCYITFVAYIYFLYRAKCYNICQFNTVMEHCKKPPSNTLIECQNKSTFNMLMECHLNLHLGCQGIPSFDTFRVLDINMRVDTPKGVLLNTYIYLCSGARFIFSSWFGLGWTWASNFYVLGIHTEGAYLIVKIPPPFKIHSCWLDFLIGRLFGSSSNLVSGLRKSTIVSVLSTNSFRNTFPGHFDSKRKWW